MFWETRDGSKIKIEDMTDSHLDNAILLLRRMAKKGMTFQYGGGGIDGDDTWYDEETLYNEEALAETKYESLMAEKKRRLNKT